MFLLKPDTGLLKKAMKCRCPKCGEGLLFKPGRLSFEINPKCNVCGLDFSQHDCGDGPIVFLHFILGFTIMPLALIAEMMFAPPLWVHGVLWLGIAIGCTVVSIKPLKSYIIALQYKHRGL